MLGKRKPLYVESGKAAEALTEKMLDQGYSEMEIIREVMKKLEFSESTAAGIYDMVIKLRNTNFC